MVFPRPLLPPMMTTFLPRKRCAFLNSFMAQSFHKDTIQFCIFSGYPVDRSDLVHAMNVLAKSKHKLAAYMAAFAQSMSLACIFERKGCSNVRFKMARIDQPGYLGELLTR